MTVAKRPSSPAPTFDIDKFWQFCASLKVSTKEFGQITLNKENLLGTQIYFVEEVAKGLSEGIHEFVVLKGRQVSITTICLALDLYWIGKNEGISGAFVTHNEEAREMFRATLAEYLENLPAKWAIPVKAHNKTQLLTERKQNRIMYLVAGTRKNSKLGKGTALTFCHLTEESEYGDEEGLASLKAAFAQSNPNRLFIHETTAQGFNHFYDTWNDAKQATTQRAIFVGWWRNQLYRKKKGSPEHTVYWDGRLLPEERKWVGEVKRLYDYTIDDEQIAWFRWQLAEVQKDDIIMYQNFPPTEDYAFVKSGSSFFSGAKINDAFKALKKEKKPAMYRFVLRDHFEETELIECGEKNANYKVWEPPQPGGHYVIGADPAEGNSAWADRFCCQVYRCYTEGMVQVAEFNTADCLTYQFAWVLCYLGGAYTIEKGSTCMLNLELNGPGNAVWTEVLNLKRIALGQSSTNDVAKKVYKVVSNLQHFMYRRQDSFGAASGYHTISTTKEKWRMLSAFKDGWERGLIEIHSLELLDEMRSVEFEEGFIGAPDRKKDDRVLASGLSAIAFIDYVRIKLVRAGVLKNAPPGDPNKRPTIQFDMSTYLKDVIKP